MDFTVCVCGYFWQGAKVGSEEPTPVPVATAEAGAEEAEAEEAGETEVKRGGYIFIGKHTHCAYPAYLTGRMWVALIADPPGGEDQEDHAVDPPPPSTAQPSAADETAATSVTVETAVTVEATHPPPLAVRAE